MLPANRYLEQLIIFSIFGCVAGNKKTEAQSGGRCGSIVVQSLKTSPSPQLGPRVPPRRRIYTWARRRFGGQG